MPTITPTVIFTQKLVPSWHVIVAAVAGALIGGGAVGAAIVIALMMGY